MDIKRILGVIFLTAFVVFMGTKLSYAIPDHLDVLSVVFYVILIGVILYLAITRILDN